MHACWFTFAAIVTSLSAIPTPAQSESLPETIPVIDSVSPVAPLRDQTITIEGHGFGSQPAYTGDSPFIRVHNQSPPWNAGFMGDAHPADLVTLSVQSWTDTKIVLTGFSGDYGRGLWVLRPHSHISFEIWNPQSHKGSAPFDVVVDAQRPKLPLSQGSPAASPGPSTAKATTADIAPLSPEAAYDGSPVTFIDHIAGNWRGTLTCPDLVASVEVTLVHMDDEHDVRGIYHARNRYGDRGEHPLKITIDERHRSIHAQLVNPDHAPESVTVTLSNSGQRLTGALDNSPCKSLVLERQADVRAETDSSAPIISSVSEILPTPRQVITITGHGFGTHPPYIGDSMFLTIVDKSMSPSWSAGFSANFPADAVTLGVTSWTDTKITLSGFINGYGNKYHLNPADKLALYLWNPSTGAGPAHFDIVVPDYPSEPDTASVPKECKNKAIDPNKRIEACTTLLTQSGNSAVLFRLRGVAYLNAGQFDMAIKDFGRSLEIDHMMIDSYKYKGIAYSKEGKPKDAIEKGFNPYIAVNAHNPDVFWYRGLNYVLIGDKSHALADANSALDINGDYYNGLVLKGALLVDSKSFIEGRKLLGRAINIDFTQWTPHYFAARAFVATGDVENARNAFTDACAYGAPAELKACEQKVQIEDKDKDYLRKTVEIYLNSDVDVDVERYHRHQDESNSAHAAEDLREHDR